MALHISCKTTPLRAMSTPDASRELFAAYQQASCIRLSNNEKPRDPCFHQDHSKEGQGYSIQWQFKKLQRYSTTGKNVPPL